MSPADPESRRSLLDAAKRIADALEVDWGERTSGLADSEARSHFDNLREVEKLVMAFRAHSPVASPSDEPAQPLFSWGQLQVLEMLGEGGFGEVYRAYDETLDREVALKLRRSGKGSDGIGGRRFFREARRLARLRHPHVVSVYGVDEHDGRVGFWTELIDGQTLTEVVSFRGPMSAEEALAVGREVCGALAAVHRVGLVHGDVKPSNVMRERGGRYVLMDLGSASLRRAASEPAWPRIPEGTPLALAPELLDGAAPSARSDIYSVGVLLYFLVSGTFPVQAESFDELMQRHRVGDLVPLRDERPDLPASFLEVVNRALTPEPDARYSSAGAMERALVQAMGLPPDEGRVEGASRKGWIPRLIVGAAFVLLAL